MIRSIVILFISVVFTKVLSLPAETKQEELKKNPEEADAEGGTDKKPKDFFRIQEEAKVLLERDPKLKPQFVAIIHNKFPHPTFLGERVPWYQVYVYSDYFLGLPMEERKKYTKLVIAEKLFESGFHRVSFNCLTMEDEKFTYTPPEDEVGGISTPRSAESEYEGPMMKRYRKVIEDNFKIHHLEILDTSDNYHLPANSEKFLTILLVTDEFIGKSEYQILKIEGKIGKIDRSPTFVNEFL